MEGMRRISFAALGAVVVASPLLLVGACGNSVSPVGLQDARESEVDVLLDAGADSTGDEPGWWSGCPDLPVVCPDADYYITINGDGPEQVLRSNIWKKQWGPSPSDAGYHLPVAQYNEPGMFGAFRVVWAADTPEGGTYLEMSPELNTCYDNNGRTYCAAVADAHADVVFTRGDPPGGFVSGTYSVSVGEFSKGVPTGEVLSLSGKFVACRICDAPPIP